MTYILYCSGFWWQD